MNLKQITDDIVILAGCYMPSTKLSEFTPRLERLTKKHFGVIQMQETKILKKARTTKQMLDEIETLTARNKELYALLRQAQGENRKLRTENQTLRHEIMDLEIAKGKVEVVYE